MNTTYTAKPNICNMTGSKTFNTAKEAIQYLNEKLSDKGDSNYTFIAPSITPKQLKHAIQEYVGISKLIIREE